MRGLDSHDLLLYSGTMVWNGYGKGRNAQMTSVGSGPKRSGHFLDFKCHGNGR